MSATLIDGDTRRRHSNQAPYLGKYRTYAMRGTIGERFRGLVSLLRVKVWQKRISGVPN